MTDPTRYSVPARRQRAEQVIERSRFIATLDRAGSPEAAHAFVRAMEAEFSDATHHVWAYAAGPPGDTGRIGLSDGGEPHGTAGRPILTALLHSGVGEVAAVVTRYYGGTKLGTGGLARAYRGTVLLALERLPTVERIETIDVALRIELAAVTPALQLLLTLEAETLSQAYSTVAEFLLRLPRQRLPELRSAIADLTRGRGEIEVVEGPRRDDPEPGA